jgi:hypothetical protein
MSGIRESPGFEAKQLCLQQRLRDSGTIDIEERSVGAGATVVDDPRHQPLSCPCLALQQHRGNRGTSDGVKRCQGADLRAQGAHHRRMADEAVGGMDG